MVMKYKGLTLDKFQIDAIEAIENNHSVVVSAPTGSGKTLTADYIINKYIKKNKRIVYTAPIKALSNQKYKDFSEEYGAANVGLMTGDLVINPRGQILIMTTEIYRNMVMTGDESVKDVAYVVFDEVHYINDIERGTVWEESIIYSPKTVRFLCLSATIPNAKEFASWISAIKKHKVKTVTSDTRAVPLTHMFYDHELGITDLKKLNKHLKYVRDMPKYSQVFRKKGKKARLTEPKPDHIDLIKRLGPDKVPCLFFSFSRRDTQEKAKELSRTNIFKKNAEIISICQKHSKNWPTEVKQLPTTRLLKEALTKGIGFHHAGLLPMLKELVEDLFAKGLIKVLYTTETFAVGINMPAKTVCFNALRKYDGRSFRGLNTKEYFQIAGRAGRRGIDKQGLVVSMVYRPSFRFNELKTLTYKDVEPIKSQFKLSVNTTLNLIDKHTQKEIEHLLRLSFFSYQKFGKNYAKVESKRILYRYNRIVKKLERAGFIKKVNKTSKDNKLTEKGKFATHIFVDEIILAEVFCSPMYKQLNDAQTLLLIAALCYESRERTKFKKRFLNNDYKKLKNILQDDPITAKEKKFENLKDVTALITPMVEGGSFFDILNNTNLLEGDLIRFFGQILDRINQIRKAGYEFELGQKMDCTEGILKRALEGIYLI